MVTLKDIAERVGVSITTVSRVLNGKGSISQETKDKVFQVMRELNYEVDSLGRNPAEVAHEFLVEQGLIES